MNLNISFDVPEGSKATIGRINPLNEEELSYLSFLTFFKSIHNREPRIEEVEFILNKIDLSPLKLKEKMNNLATVPKMPEPIQDMSESILDDYTPIKSIEIGGKIWIFFNISVNLYNSGNIKSDNITIKLQDEDFNYTQKGFVMPGETKKFIFIDHPLLGLGKHIIDITYYPTNLDIPLTDDNSGSISIIVEYGYGDVDVSTPGFEFISLIALLAIIFIILRKRLML